MKNNTRGRFSKRILKAAALILSSVTALASAVSAAPMRIASVTDNLENPLRVAVDSQGSLYVTEAGRNRVTKFTGKGQRLGSFSVPYPLGVAVDSAGRIYVGSGADRAVHVYHADFSPAGRLDAGVSDCKKPNSIAIDSAGRIYVADTVGHAVRVYEPGGARMSFPWGATFRKPMGVAVGDAAGELYVADVPVLSTTNGPTDGARIQVFDKSGAYKRTIAQTVGNQSIYTEIAVDKTGLLYVTDSMANVFVFDPASGAPQGVLSDPRLPFVNPKGIAVTKSNLAYVAVPKGAREDDGRVDVYALDGYVDMAVSPLAVSFEARQYGANPAPRTIMIANPGGGTLTWSAATTSPWLILGQVAGATPAGTASSLSISIAGTALPAGAYSGSVTISTDHGQTEVVSVSLAVLPPAMLSVSSGSLSFAVTAGSAPASQKATVAIDNVASLSWSAAPDSPWLAIAPAAGTATTETTVTVNTAFLAAGTHTGHISFQAPGAVGDGSKLTVTVTVLAAATAGNTLRVTTNHQGAAFTVTGPATYEGMGMSWSASNAPAGAYTVTYHDVPGHRRPRPETKSVGPTGLTAFAAHYASYEELAGRRNIIVAKGRGTGNDGQVKAYKDTGQPVAFDLTAPGAEVAAGDVDGDGTAELITSSGDDPGNPALVRIYKADKTLFAELTVFDAPRGTRITAGDLDGDGSAELVVASSGSDTSPAFIRVYAFDAASAGMVPTGIEFIAHGYPCAASVVVADTEGDGRPEIVTAPSEGGQNPVAIRTWKVGTAGGTGHWTASLGKETALPAASAISLAAGQVDEDKEEELIIATAFESAGGSFVTILKADGTQKNVIKAAGGNGAKVAAADLSGDGKAEVIVAPLPGPDEAGGAAKNVKKQKDGKEGKEQGVQGDGPAAAVYVYSASGALSAVITPFEEAPHGVNVAVGDMGL